MTIDNGKINDIEWTANFDARAGSYLLSITNCCGLASGQKSYFVDETYQLP